MLAIPNVLHAFQVVQHALTQLNVHNARMDIMLMAKSAQPVI
jgi:hypothetical protein